MTPMGRVGQQSWNEGLTKYTADYVEAELKAYLKERAQRTGKTDWPTFKEFKADGRGALLHALYDWYEPGHWQKRLGFPHRRRGGRPKGSKDSKPRKKAER